MFAKELPTVLTVNVAPGVGSGIRKNSSEPPVPALGLGNTLLYTLALSVFVNEYGNCEILIAVWQALFVARFGMSDKVFVAAL